MRLKVMVRVEGILPKSYGYYLSSFFFRQLEKLDEDMAAFLHRFSPYKPYNFSRVLAKPAKVERDSLFFERNTPGTLYISSPFERIVGAFFDVLVSRGCIDIKGNCLRVEGVERVPYPPEKFNFSTLSPVVATVKREKKVYLNPTEGEFHQELLLNLLDRYRRFVGREPGRITIHIDEFKPRLVYVKDTRIPSYDLRGKIYGDVEMVRFLWDSGLGEKTGLGFGMVGLWESTS